MATENFRNEKQAVITFAGELGAIHWRSYLQKIWTDVTRGLSNVKITVIAGVHGGDDGTIGPDEDNVVTCQKQLQLLKTKNASQSQLQFEGIVLDIRKFLDENRVLDWQSLKREIEKGTPDIILFSICYSDVSTIKNFLEKSGILAQIRTSRDLNILSNGKITMNEIQKRFIEKLADEKNVEKDVIVTGPVGSGKTLLGLEAINIKKSHYKKKYGISSSDCQNQLRVIILIGYSRDGSQLKQQLEKSESHNDCSLDIKTEWPPNSEKLTRIFQANENYNSYKHTLILMDEIRR